MIEQIIDGIWEDIKDRVRFSSLDDSIQDKAKCRWRIIIRKAIAESQKKKGFPFVMGYEGGRRIADKIGSCSQAMLEETAVMDR